MTSETTANPAEQLAAIMDRVGEFIAGLTDQQVADLIAGRASVALVEAPYRPPTCICPCDHGEGGDCLSCGCACVPTADPISCACCGATDDDDDTGVIHP